MPLPLDPLALALVDPALADRLLALGASLLVLGWAIKRSPRSRANDSSDPPGRA